MFIVYSDMFRLTSHLQAGTLFVYKVTVLIPGSQTLTCVFTLMLSAVLQLEVVTNVIVKML